MFWNQYKRRESLQLITIKYFRDPEPRRGGKSREARQALEATGDGDDWKMMMKEYPALLVGLDAI